MMLLQGKGLCKGSPGFSSGGSKLSAKTLPSSRLRLLSSVNKAMSPRQHSSGANGGPPALLLELFLPSSILTMWEVPEVHSLRLPTSPFLLARKLDGAVVDLHHDGHRVAFNRAFESLGFECVNWPAHVYNDLLGRGDGTPEGFIAAYFEMMGWPEMMATSDRPRFLTKVREASGT
eukprot:1145149-Pelagomonas_calceolata.AAC.5